MRWMAQFGRSENKKPLQRFVAGALKYYVVPQFKCVSK